MNKCGGVRFDSCGDGVVSGVGGLSILGENMAINPC